MQIQSQILNKIQNLHYGFGTKETPVPAAFESCWTHRPKHHQIHGTRVVEVRKPLEELGDCDALWTREKNLPLAIATADCVPILLANPTGTCIAAVHAGWRGTYAHILRSLWEKLTQ